MSNKMVRQRNSIETTKVEGSRIQEATSFLACRVVLRHGTSKKCVERCCELANKKTEQLELKEGTSPCIPFKKE